MKMYVDTTGELVIEAGNEAHYYPAFSEIKRVNVDADSAITICHLFAGRGDSPYAKWVTDINGTPFGDIQDAAGDPYASFALAWAAIDAYFDDQA